MAKVHFAPYSAIKYVGSKAKDFNTSLARPKPTLKKGDIVIVEKKDAFNLVSKGFGEFVAVVDIEFVKKDSENAIELNDEIIRLNEEVARLESENTRLNQQLLVALPALADTEDKKLNEAFGVIPVVAPDVLVVDNEVLDALVPAVSE